MPEPVRPSYFAPSYTVEAFSQAIVAPLRAQPCLLSHAARTRVVERALNAYFFAGRTFVFFDPFTLNEHWRERDGRPTVLINPAPDALGCASQDEAIARITALLAAWGAPEYRVGYMGAPHSAQAIARNEEEAQLNTAVREAVSKKFGDAALAHFVRARPGSTSFLRSSAAYHTLRTPSKNGVRTLQVPITLPGGRDDSFTLHVERSGLVPDLCTYFFGTQTFAQFLPFQLHVYEGANKSRQYSLILCVHPRELGFTDGAEAADAIPKIAIELGYPELALKMQVLQGPPYSAAQLTATGDGAPRPRIV